MSKTDEIIFVLHGVINKTKTSHKFFKTINDVVKFSNGIYDFTDSFLEKKNPSNLGAYEGPNPSVEIANRAYRFVNIYNIKIKNPMCRWDAKPYKNRYFSVIKCKANFEKNKIYGIRFGYFIDYPKRSYKEKLYGKIEYNLHYFTLPQGHNDFGNLIETELLRDCQILLEIDKKNGAKDVLEKKFKCEDFRIKTPIHHTDVWIDTSWLIKGDSRDSFEEHGGAHHFAFLDPSICTPPKDSKSYHYRIGKDKNSSIIQVFDHPPIKLEIYPKIQDFLYDYRDSILRTVISALLAMGPTALVLTLNFGDLFVGGSFVVSAFLFKRALERKLI
jgi:hypothetical protein